MKELCVFIEECGTVLTYVYIAMDVPCCSCKNAVE